MPIGSGDGANSNAISWILVPDAEQVFAEHAGHQIELEEPELVVTDVRKLSGDQSCWTSTMRPTYKGVGTTPLVSVKPYSLATSIAVST